MEQDHIACCIAFSRSSARIENIGVSNDSTRKLAIVKEEKRMRQYAYEL